jgi:hypothetical protein
MRLHSLLWGRLYFVYVGDVRTSQEAYASTACYGESFTCLYVDDVRTSQEACAFTACYGDSFTLSYVDDVPTSVPHRTHSYGPPWPVMEIAVLILFRTYR